MSEHAWPSLEQPVRNLPYAKMMSRAKQQPMQYLKCFETKIIGAHESLQEVRSTVFIKLTTRSLPNISCLFPSSYYDIA